MSNIDQEMVKSIFDYRDGFLLWKIRPSNRCGAIGTVAGTSAIIKNYGRRFSVSINGKRYLSSRIIFLWNHGYLPKEVDHEDRDVSNNKIENLRDADRLKNCCNVRSHNDSVSIYLGVHYDRQTCKWRCGIQSGDLKIKSKRMDTEQEAALQYNRLAVKHHGEFANLNIIKPPVNLS